MATHTKPYRIFETDTNAVTRLAAARGCSGAELVHEALQEYLVSHRHELAAAFADVQQALASGDLGRLGDIATCGRQSQVDAIMADLSR